MISKPTSHFLGYTIRNQYLIDLCSELNSYVRANHISDAIVVQNSNSIHFTLYYLPSVIEGLQRNNISNYLNTSSTRAVSCYIDSISYFMKDSHKSILYLSLLENSDLVIQNEFLRKYFSNQIFENKLSFIPHITILRIFDPSIFSLHQGAIVKIIKKYIFQIKQLDGYLNLYAVDSTYTPEIQEVVEI